jgi:hypothetical protein
MKNVNFLRWLFGLVTLGMMSSLVSDAADPRSDSPVYHEYLRLVNLPEKDLVSSSFAPNKVVPPVFCLNKETAPYGRRIFQVCTSMVSNPIGKEILATLIAYCSSRGQRVQFRKGFMDPSDIRIPVAGVRAPDKTGMISVYCFPNDSDMFQPESQDEYAVGIAIDPANAVQYVALQRLSEDEQLAHELIHAIRMVTKTSLDPENQALLIQGLYDARLKQLGQLVEPEIMNTIRPFWSSDEEVEVITGWRFVIAGRFPPDVAEPFQLSEARYRAASSAVHTHLRVFELSMVGLGDGAPQLSPSTNLGVYYADTPIGDFLANEKIHAITRELFGLQ